MPEYKRVLDSETYDAKRRAVIDDILLDDVANALLPSDFTDWGHETALSAQDYLFRDHLDEYTLESVASITDCPQFDTHDINLAQKSEHIIDNIARGSVLADCRVYLNTYQDPINRTLFLHRGFSDAILAGELFDTPSDLVADVTRFLITDYENAPLAVESDTDAATDGGTTDSTEVGGDVGFELEDFNEQHVRGIELLDYQNPELVSALTTWAKQTLTINDNPFPDCYY